MAVIFTIGIIAGVLATFFSPFIGLYAFTVSLYIKPGMFASFLATARPSFLFGVLTLAMVLMNRRNRVALVFFKDVPSRWLLAFGVMLCLSMTTSIWRGNTQEFIVYFLKIYAAYFLILNLVSSVGRFRALVWSMTLSMVYIGVASILEYYGGGASGGRMFGAFHGALFDDPNDLAMGFTILIPFLYFDLLRGRNVIRKIFEIALIVLFLWAIVLTQSRGGFIGLMVMLLMLWIKNKAKVRLAIIGAVALLVLWQAAPEAYRNRILTIGEAREQDAAAISRMDAWRAGLNMMTGRVFGVGGGNFGEGFVRYRPFDAVDFPGMRRSAHNMFIHVGGETGFPGLFVFVGMILAALGMINKVKKGTRQSISGGRQAEQAGLPTPTVDKSGGKHKGVIIIEKESGIKEDIEKRKEIGLLADATFVSLVGYCAAGVFLSQAYNFVLYYLIAFSVVLLRISDDSRVTSGE